MNEFRPFPLRDNLAFLPTSPATVAVAALIVAVVAGTSMGWLRWESLAFRNDLAGTQWWRSFTYIVVHAGWVHAALNLVLLYLYGPQLERLVGSATFVALAIGGGACGVVLLLAIWPTQGSTRGASMTTFAIVGALVAMYATRAGLSPSTTRVVTVAVALVFAAGLLTVGGVGTLAAPGWPGVVYGSYVHATGVVVGLTLGLLASSLTGSARPAAVGFVAALCLVGLTAVGSYRWNEKYRTESPPQASSRVNS